MSRKLISTVSGAAIFIASIGIIGRSIGFIREVVYANTFGLNKDFDIYLVAAVLPVIINTSVLYLSQNFFIPSYYKIPSEKIDEQKYFLNKYFWIFTYSGIVLTIFLFLCKDIIISHYLWNSDKNTREIATKVFELFILSIPFNTGYSILSVYLQAEFKFIHPTLSHLLLNIPIIILVLLFSKVFGIYAIGLGYLSGSLIQLSYLYLIVRKKISFQFLSSFKKDRTSYNFSSNLLIVILIEIIGQLHIFIDRYFYNFVETGGIASLNYANVLFILPVSIFSVALSTAVFPRLSEFFQKNDSIILEKYFNISLRVLTLLFVPLVFIYYFDGDNIIRILFQHGEFKSTDTVITHNALKMYTFSLIFYSVYAVINKLAYSAGLTKQLLSISSIFIILKLILNFILVDSLKQNGLALSSSICYILICIGSLWIVNSKLHFKNKFALLTNILLFTFTAIISYYVAINLGDLFNIWWVFRGGIKLIIFLAVYSLTIYLLKIKIVL